LAAALKTEAAKRGLLLLTCGNYNNAIRVMVPLTIPFAILEEGLAIFDAALTSVCTAHVSVVNQHLEKVLSLSR
jgi:4-aminobutyrate aminotransferase-like enzyme